MKKLLTLLIGIFAISIASAQTSYVTNNMAAGLRTVVNEAVVLQSLSVTGTSNTIVRLYDGPPTNVVGAYSNYTIFATNRVTTFVGVNGITNNFTNTVLYTSLTSVAAATNNAVPLLTLNIGANVAPFTFNTPMIFSRSVGVSNDLGGVTLVLTYTQP